MKKHDEKRNRSQFVSETLDSWQQDVLHNMSVPALLPWRHTGFQTSQILEALRTTFGLIFAISQWYLICLNQQAYKYFRSSLWPCYMFFELKITQTIEMRLGRLEKSEFPWEPNY